MSEAKHTPGPWKLCQHLADHDQCPCGYRGGIWGSDGEHIVCEMGSTEVAGQEGMEPARYPREIEFANARLIAAAPDLLDQLQLARRLIGTQAMMLGMQVEGSPLLAEMDAAIAKATGGQP